jgi:hypothetical protein
MRNNALAVRGWERILEVPGRQGIQVSSWVDALLSATVSGVGP